MQYLDQLNGQVDIQLLLAQLSGCVVFDLIQIAVSPSRGVELEADRTTVWQFKQLQQLLCWECRLVQLHVL